MSTDHESLLSAYLDGQLVPDEKQSAEAALASDPAAVEELRSLAGVRDLVAGLSRPAAPDLAPEVMRRLVVGSSGRRFAGAWVPWSRHRAFVSGAAAGLAGLVLAGGYLQSRPRHVAPHPVLAQSVEAAPAPPDVDASLKVATAAPVGPPRPIQERPSTDGASVSSSPDAVISDAKPAAENSAASLARASLHGLLNDQEPPRVFLVTDLDGLPIREQVVSLLGSSTHRDFHQFEIPPTAAATGAPSPSTRSTVFAVTLDPSELATLRDRLTTAFAERLEESEAEPALLTQLADLGQVSTLPANPAADVLFPQTALSLRVHAPRNDAWPPAPEQAERAEKDRRPSAKQPAQAGVASEKSTVGQSQEASAGVSNPPLAPGETAATDLQKPSVVLVWIIGPIAD